VLLGPALQFSRLLYSAQSVPYWAKSHVSQSWLTLKTLQLAFALPLLLVVSQVRPCYYCVH
jgi:hypothetical protein